MKKRVMSILLTMVLILSMLIPQVAFAEDNQQQTPQYNNATFNDLVSGDRYGIYPMNWYITKDITKDSIKSSDVRVLTAGLKKKILKTEMAKEINKPVIKNASKYKVKDILTILYSVMTSYEYTKDLNFSSNTDPIDYMVQNGLYNKETDVALNKTCTLETAMGLSSRMITYLYKTLDAGSKGFLWKIEKEGNTAYLLGSIHVASSNLYPFSNSINSAYQEADELYVEADILQGLTDMDTITKLNYYTDGTTLKEHVSPELYDKVVKAAAYIGLTEEQIKQYTAIALWSTFSMLSYTGTEASTTETVSTSLGIDYSMLVDSYMIKKPIKELEGIDFQADLLSGFSDELKSYLLESSVDSFLDAMSGKVIAQEENSAVQLSDWEEYWRNGDVDSFLKTVSTEDLDSTLSVVEDSNSAKLSEEYYTKLITNRDKGMADKIDKLLLAEGENTYFIVVGSLHYISDYSVIDILTEKGYTITQVK